MPRMSVNDEKIFRMLSRSSVPLSTMEIGGRIGVDAARQALKRLMKKGFVQKTTAFAAFHNNVAHWELTDSGKAHWKVVNAAQEANSYRST